MSEYSFDLTKPVPASEIRTGDIVGIAYFPGEEDPNVTAIEILERDAVDWGKYKYRLLADGSVDTGDFGVARMYRARTK